MYTYKSVDFNPFEDSDGKNTIAPNDSQKEIWLSCVIGGTAASLVYNECISFELKGKLDPVALDKSVHDLAVRHEALRCNFDVNGDKIIIYPDSKVVLQHLDYSTHDNELGKAALDRFISKQLETPFDLISDALLRVSLCRMDAEKHVLVFTIHHIIGDSRSQRVLFKELSELYAFHIGKGERLPLPSVQMSDFLKEETRFKGSDDYVQNKAYWLDLFKTGTPETNLITDFERKYPRSFNGDRVDVELPDRLLYKLEKLSKEKQCSLDFLLLCAFEVFISKKTSQKELVIAFPSAGQLASGHPDLVGHYVTTLPLKSSIESDHTFLEYLSVRKPDFLDAIDHQRFSFMQLLKELKIPRDSSRVPLVPIMFNVDMGMDDGVAFLGLAQRLINNKRKHENFELFLTVYGTREKTTLECSYNQDLFKCETIQIMMGEFSFLLAEIVKAANTPIKNLFLQDPKVQLEKLRTWNNTYSAYSKEDTLITFFEKWASEMPDKGALSFHSKIISYKELNERSNQLANLLLSQGITRGDSIGIIMNRSDRMIISLLATLKCGGTFVPIDPEFPNDRVLYMLEDSAVKLVITTTFFQGQFSTRSKELLIEDIWKELADYSSTNFDRHIAGKDLAYILYTSGSTGKPKGVQIRHSNLLNFLLSMQKAPGIQSDDKFLASTTISFDISILEIFLPLISGAQIVLIDEQMNRNGKSILDTIKREKVTIMQGGPALYSVMLYEEWNEKLPLKVLCGGEAFPKDLAGKLLSRCSEVWNMYGPTETTVWSTIKKLSADDERITVGKPIDNTQVYILDEDLALVQEGYAGEIYISGDGLASGYLNRAELTAQKFIKNPFVEDQSALMYGTGDMGIRLANGEIQCLGRLDHQIKIRGIRIELGEIEQALLHQEGIREVIVMVWEETPENKQLCAYVIPTEDCNENTERDYKVKWRERLKEELPIYMVPHNFVIVSTFPLTPNGKIDRKALPKPEPIRPERATLYAAPNTEIENKLASVWSSLLRIDKVGIDDNFFDIGGDSLLAVKSVTELRSRFGFELAITQLYQFPTIKKLAILIEADEKRKEVKNGAIKFSNSQLNKELLECASGQETAIAVIAMTGRFPKSDSVNELWTLLKEGKEGTSFFSKEELDITIPEEERNDPDYVAARGIISGVEYFDPAFFGINPRLAELMDPQQRVFLEICWEALEESGYTDQHYAGSIGIFAGCANGSYFLDNVQHHKRLIQNIGSLQVQIANEKDYLSSRVAYAMNLKGPAVTVQSACSTSLLAIAQAVESLRSGTCDLALAGGVSVMTPIKSGHIYQEGSMQSSDGHCRPFDAEATGTIFSDGAGVVLLKPLEAARRDGDTIYAVVKGIGMSNDGSAKGSFTAPSSEGQSKAINMALQDAKFAPKTISYVETHGTATPLGDPIEFEGLKRAFNLQGHGQFCAIGSIKSNIGHLNTAAGVTGFIKTCLALHHRQIPSSLNYVKPNPHIHFEDSPFYVNTTLCDWTLNEYSPKRRAGISSFGVGGTNVHIVLEESECLETPKLDPKPFALINWSAMSAGSREVYREKLLSYLNVNPSVQPVDIAFTLHTTRTDFHFRQFLIASTREQLIEQLITGSTPAQTHALEETIEEVAFVFPGQGSQYLGMGRELYNSEPVFKAATDECVAHLQILLKESILDVVFSVDQSEEAQTKLNNTYYTQPALFVIEYALAKLMMSWGIQPAVFLGHSIGEFVAAHLAGVFSLKDALFLISTRGKLMADLPHGKMLAIRAKHEDILAILPSNLSMAAINSARLCVVAGAVPNVIGFVSHLEDQTIASTYLQTSHAFHSTMMDEIVEPFEAIIRTISLHKPSIPIISSVTGTWITDTEAQDPHYWASHLRNTVDFLKASTTLLNDKKRFILECGPGNVLTTLLKQHGNKHNACSPTLHMQKGESEAYAITHALGQLWLKGISIDWNGYYANQKIRKLQLPAYAFVKKRHWVEPLLHNYLSAESKMETPILRTL